MKSNKNLKAMVSLLREISSRGGLEREQMETLEAIIRKVDHAVSINNKRMLRKAWDDLARELCIIFMRKGD